MPISPHLFGFYVGFHIDADELMIIWLLALIRHLICVSQSRQWEIFDAARFCHSKMSGSIFCPRESGVFVVPLRSHCERKSHENDIGRAAHTPSAASTLHTHTLYYYRRYSRAVIYSLDLDAILICTERMKCNFSKSFFLFVRSSSSALYLVHLCID